MLTGTQAILAESIVTALESFNGELIGDARVLAVEQWTAISEAIIDHIVENAVTQSVTTSSGATLSGPPGGPLPIAALPGTATGVIE